MRKKYYKTEWRKAFFNEMIEQYGDKCMICKRHVRHLVVDHDHKTGLMRGLLCTAHNFGLGNFQDSVEFLKNAVEYLETMGPKSQFLKNTPTEDPGIIRKMSVKQDDVRNILLDASFKNDSRRAKELTRLFAINYAAAQSRVYRDRVKMEKENNAMHALGCGSNASLESTT